MKPETAHVKGTDLVIIKKMFKEKGDSCLEEFDAGLTPETHVFFKSLMPTNWVPNAAATEIMEKAALFFYPGQADDLEQLGRACSRQAFRGVYKTFFRIISVPFLLKHVPLIWNMYHSVGKAGLLMADEKTGATLTVTGAPEVSVSNLRLVSGFSLQALRKIFPAN